MTPEGILRGRKSEDVAGRIEVVAKVNRSETIRMGRESKEGRLLEEELVSGADADADGRIAVFSATSPARGLWTKE